MSTIANFNNLAEVATEFRKDLTGDNRRQKDLILFYAHNGTGKTRLSMEFKEAGKADGGRDTLYFNAFTEDLFNWDNDLEGDEQRVLLLNKDSQFFGGIEALDIDNKIRPLLHKYSDFNFITDFNYVKPGEAGNENPVSYWAVKFIREELVDGVAQNVDKIKISRGEENLFIWCFFLAIYELAIDSAEGYDWVKYVYIDDPISSLDENNAIALAVDLANMIRRDGNEIKTVISTHHSLFFNVMFNELTRKVKNKCYFLHSKNSGDFNLQNTGDTPFFHHVAILSHLKQVALSNEIYTYHFNALRNILEKTASFFGYADFDKCISGFEGDDESDKILFKRVLNLLSHGPYSVFSPREMNPDNKILFKRVLNGFTTKYEFHLPEIFNEAIPAEEVSVEAASIEETPVDADQLNDIQSEEE